MHQVAPAAGTGTSDRATGEFFIPDLCAPRPVFFLVLLTELLVLVHTLASSQLPLLDWELLALGSLGVQWVVLCSAALLCLQRPFLARRSLVLAATACLLTILLVTAVSSLAAASLLRVTGWITDGSWLLRNLLIAALVGGIVLRYFYLQQQLVLRDRAALQARLDALRARIRPHFLFNTLNSIASLIDTRPREAEEAILDLAALLRASLREPPVGSSVADELRLCESYLAIEQLRLGDRLQVDWQVEEAVRQLPMPSLLLQPLLENAIHHGIARLPTGGCVRIALWCESGYLHARVENPCALENGDSPGIGMALDNIRQRLRALFGEAARLSMEREHFRCQVFLSYPVDAAP